MIDTIFLNAIRLSEHERKNEFERTKMVEHTGQTAFLRFVYLRRKKKRLERVAARMNIFIITER